MSENKHLLGNEPINNFEQDLFNFKHYAEKLKKIIQLNSNNNEPLTFGIYGKWGEGKTSFLNLLRHKIEHFDKSENGKEYLLYDFNPWRYSNEDEMLFDFFDGIAKKFYVNKETSVQEVGKWISKYSKYLKAVKISATVGLPKVLNSKIEFNPDKIFEALGEDLSGEKITLDKLKEKVNEAIKKVNFKLLIFIDDLDRLDKNEIYTILKLIKLNANFDNFIFITTLDSEHVAKAIKDRYGDEKEDGILFLEKIINIPIHLPKIEEEDLKFYFEKKLDEVSKKLGLNRDKEEEIRLIKQDLQLNLFKSPREIIRVLNSFFISAFGFETEVNLRDLFWIEFLKIKEENLYEEVKKYYKGDELQVFFLGQSEFINFNDDIFKKQNLIHVKEPNGTRKEFLEKYPKSFFIIDILFPLNLEKSDINNNSFDLNLNINSLNHFNKYFSFHTENKLKNITIENIKNQIVSKNEEKLIIGLKDLFKNENLIHKAVYKLETLIKFYKDDNSSKKRDFFYLFITKNIHLIPETNQDVFGISAKINLIEIIGTILNNDNDEHNKNEKISIEIAENLDVNSLCHFVRKFRIEQSSYKNKLESFISVKANSTFSKENPLVLNTNISNKMIMTYWKKDDPQSFKVHINDTLDNLNIIKKFIRQFAPYWNNSYYGMIDKQEYEYINNLIDSSFIIEKIEKIDDKICAKVKSDYSFSNKEESTEEENLEEFIYWHKKVNNLF